MIFDRSTVIFFKEEMSPLNYKEHKETIRHMLRCACIAYKFAEYIGLNDKDKALLSKSALLHDIGKFRIPTGILYKRGRLSDNEFAVIKTHTEYLNVSNKLDNIVLEVINFHHERPDCKGYKGINANELHDFVKIISIIDAYDVMMNKRCYKNIVLSKEQIYMEIFNNIGKQFDCKYALLFLNFLNKKSTKN